MDRRQATGLPTRGGADFVERIAKKLRAAARALRSAKLGAPRFHEAAWPGMVR